MGGKSPVTRLARLAQLFSQMASSSAKKELLEVEGVLVALVIEGCEGDGRSARLARMRQLLAAAGLRGGRLDRVLSRHATRITHALLSPPLEAAVEAARVELALRRRRRQEHSWAMMLAARRIEAASRAASVERFRSRFKPEE